MGNKIKRERLPAGVSIYYAAKAQYDAKLIGDEVRKALAEDRELRGYGTTTNIYPAPEGTK